MIDLSPSQDVKSTVKSGVKQVAIQQQITDFNEGTDISSITAIPPQSSISSSTNLDNVFAKGNFISIQIFNPYYEKLSNFIWKWYLSIICLAEGSDVGSTEVRPPSNLPNSRFTDFQVPLQLGCAAALLCVEEQFCTKEGVISTQPITFTEKDVLRRVPLSVSCKLLIIFVYLIINELDRYQMVYCNILNKHRLMNRYKFQNIYYICINIWFF